MKSRIYFILGVFFTIIFVGDFIGDLYYGDFNYSIRYLIGILADIGAIELSFQPSKEYKDKK